MILHLPAPEAFHLDNGSPGLAGRCFMNVTVSLPDEILSQDSGEISRQVLEQVALDGFKSGQLTTAQVRRILGFESRLEVYDFLAAHDVPWVDYSEEELRRETDRLSQLVP